MKIIPAIDLIEGKCVRLTQGDYQQRTLYHENPLEVAKRFEDMGVKYLHLVDLDGAKAKRIINYPTLEAIASHTQLQIDFGGGMKREEDIRIALESGAKQVTVGSIAAKSPELFAAWLDEFGADQLILGADAKEGKIAVSGWQEITELDIIPFIQNWQKQGVQKVICTDISKDGMLAGPSFALYQSIKEQIPHIQLIASGGVSSEADVQELQEMGIDGVIIGKAIYEGRIDLQKIIMGLTPPC